MHDKILSIFNTAINLENQTQNDIPNNMKINIIRLKFEMIFMNLIVEFFIDYPDSCIQFIYDFTDIETIDD
ncbi:hypothetical protein HERIO_2459 [Hepatospora eriocheir]|uniref:Uncharacterized protein n=1 Tax=Hepatospora eriocheir TaxID=1081669 RepID=A0A1X0Q6W2_9MICR|nr:hypothetical protein HERIO_2459 [Hepatospora eriocheir]